MNKFEELRKYQEKEFFNKIFSKEKFKKKISKYHSSDQKSVDFYRQYLLLNCVGKRVLDYGCGLGTATLFLAKNGAQVIGIDISQEAIKQARRRAMEENLADKTNFFVMDAEAMEFEDNSFDIVCGTAILHHLNLNKALPELARVLKPNGTGIFREPLGYNPIINLYRKLTPYLHTPDEHPLVMRDLKLIEFYFKNVKIDYFHLFSPFAIFFKNTEWFDKLRKLLDNLDMITFGVLPFLQWLSRVVVIRFSFPKK